MKYYKTILISSLFIFNFKIDKNNLTIINDKKNKSLIYFDKVSSWNGKEPRLDTTINKELILDNQKSIAKHFGDLYHKNFFPKDETSRITNIDKSICLYMRHEVGGGPNSYDRFMVFPCKTCKNCLVINFKNFKTESGVELWMDKNQFLKQNADKKFKQSAKKDTIVLSYEYPPLMYSAEYFFVKERLVKFDFGYDTP